MANNLNPKNLTLNWETPTSSRGGYQNDIPKNFILLRNVNPKIHNVKNASTYLSFSVQALEYLFKENPHKIAISFDKDRLIFCFNPKNGTPYYKLSKSGNSKVLNNKALVTKIYKFFGLDEKIDKYFLKAHYYAEINELKLYILTPQTYDSRLPVFEDERKGEFSIHA